MKTIEVNKTAFTLAKAAKPRSNSVNTSKIAFTLAEVLITLGIIGIVAAMTLPALIAKHQKDVTINQLKKVYTVMSQALVMSINENGPAENWIDTNAILNEVSSTQYFETYWKPYLKLNKKCKTFKECGYKQSLPWYNANGNNVSVMPVDPNTRNSFYLNDGTFIMMRAMDYDNSDPDNPVAKFVKTQTLYIDLNGYKGPNIFGKDVFYFVIDLDKHIITSPNIDSNETTIINNCKNIGYSCTTLIMRDGWKISDKYPW